MIKNVTRSPTFIRQCKHLDPFLSNKLSKQIEKILLDPNVGKPLNYRRGERVLYVKPFRLIYVVQGEELILLKFDHRRHVYK